VEHLVHVVASAEPDDVVADHETAKHLVQGRNTAAEPFCHTPRLLALLFVAPSHLQQARSSIDDRSRGG
jgi:hypothetical protein